MDIYFEETRYSFQGGILKNLIKPCDEAGPLGYIDWNFASVYQCCRIGAIIVCIRVNKFIYILGCFFFFFNYHYIIIIIMKVIYVFLISLFKSRQDCFVVKRERDIWSSNYNLYIPSLVLLSSFASQFLCFIILSDISFMFHD